MGSETPKSNFEVGKDYIHRPARMCTRKETNLKTCRRRAPPGHPLFKKKKKECKWICMDCYKEYKYPNTEPEKPDMKTTYRYYPAHFDGGRWEWSMQLLSSMVKDEIEKREREKAPGRPPITHVMSSGWVGPKPVTHNDVKEQVLLCVKEQVLNHALEKRRRLPIHER